MSDKQLTTQFQPGDDRFFTEVTSGKGPFALPEKERGKAISESGRTRLTAVRAGRGDPEVIPW